MCAMFAILCDFSVFLSLYQENWLILFVKMCVCVGGVYVHVRTLIGRNCYSLKGMHIAELVFQALKNGPFCWHCTSVGFTRGQISGSAEGIYFESHIMYIFSEIYFL